VSYDFKEAVAQKQAAAAQTTTRNLFQPRITEANCTDFRTPDGIRVLRCEGKSGSGSLYLRFEDKFDISYHNTSDCWDVRCSDGYIPASTPAIYLVYDPVSKAVPPTVPWALPTTTEKPFFMVWNPSTGKSTFRHYTEVAALREAERLAATNAGSTFYVLKAISRSQTNGVTSVELI
jgi:hypothetical protein